MGSDYAGWVHDIYSHLPEADLALGRQALISGATGESLPKVYMKARGSKFWTSDGMETIDCTSQAWTLGVGACHPKIIEAVKAQLDYFTHVRTNFDTPPKLILSKRLAEIAPGELKRVAFSLHGSTAMEGAMKIAMQNKPGRKYFVSVWDNFSGRTFATMDISYPHQYPYLQYTGNRVRVPQAYCYRCHYGKTYPECNLYCADMMDRFISNSIDGQPIALIIEPIQANGGQIPFPKPYYKAIRELCDKHDMLLIFDEIQTGFGRVGKMFAAELYDTIPDILVFGKSLGGGFPLAGSLQDTTLQGFKPGDHTFTFAHFPVSMIAGLATLRVIEEENLLENCRKMGDCFTERLLELQRRYEMIGDVRGPGLMIGVELVKTRQGKEKATKETSRFIEESFRRGVQFGHSKYGGLGNVVKIKPPLTISESEVEKVMDVFEEVIELVSHDN
jgi:4-aminobutyrate aminotransferase-like enzyme